MAFPSRSTIQNFLEQHLPDSLELLRQMVAINSFTANPQGVNALAALTADSFSALGFQATTVPSKTPGFGNHLILERTGRSDERVAFISHLDTVFPPEDEIENDFNWRVEKDRIFGPGVVDIKGGTVMILMILSAIQHASPETFDRINWSVILNASEETMEHDFEQLCVSHLTGNVLGCLIFEGGIYRDKTFKLIANRKGMANFRVAVEGKSAHAGSAHKDGANAIVQMAHIVQEIAGFTDYEKDITYNVGKISGGTVTNRVPHAAEIWVEMRAFDPQVFSQGVAKMMELQNRSEVSSFNGYACKVNVDLLNTTDPWEPNAGSDELLRNWQQAAEAMGMELSRGTRGGLSDGNRLWKHFPTLDALGPFGGNAHSSERSPDGTKEQEYVRVSSFVPKATLNTLAILRLVGEEK